MGDTVGLRFGVGYFSDADGFKVMTEAQKKALVALSLCKPGFHSRAKLAYIARGAHGPSYPLKTLTGLQALGYAQPEHQVAVDLVENRSCRCACDRWQITEAGRAFVSTLLVNDAREGLK